MLEAVFFYIFAILAVFFAIFVVFQSDPVRSALSLVACFLQVAALFVLLRSPFLATVQVFVYVGAVVVLFLFVVMVLELKKEKIKEYLHIKQKPWVAIVMAGILLELGYIILSGRFGGITDVYSESYLHSRGNTETIGNILFTKYLLPFEVVSLLLLVALIGAVLLTLRKEGE